MNSKWLFRNGATTIECTSFPYAFRVMHNTIRRGVEKDGKKREDLTKRMSIVSPIKNRMGDTKVYSYAEAMEMAKNNGLMSADGQLNSREFRRT